MNVSDLAGIHTDTLNEALGRLRFSDPVTHVYNPHQSARRPWTQYIERYARPGVKAFVCLLFLIGFPIFLAPGDQIVCLC